MNVTYSSASIQRSKNSRNSLRIPELNTRDPFRLWKFFILLTAKLILYPLWNYANLAIWHIWCNCWCTYLVLHPIPGGINPSIHWLVLLYDVYLWVFHIQADLHNPAGSDLWRPCLHEDLPPGNIQSWSYFQMRNRVSASLLLNGSSRGDCHGMHCVDHTGGDALYFCDKSDTSRRPAVPASLWSCYVSDSQDTSHSSKFIGLGVSDL